MSNYTKLLAALSGDKDKLTVKRILEAERTMNSLDHLSFIQQAQALCMADELKAILEAEKEALKSQRPLYPTIYEFYYSSDYGWRADGNWGKLPYFEIKMEKVK